MELNGWVIFSDGEQLTVKRIKQKETQVSLP